MKTKNFRKKLTFNKQTIADLSGNEMRNVYGGYKITDVSCPTDYSCPDFEPYETIDCTNDCTISICRP
jgi:natural product precursor